MDTFPDAHTAPRIFGIGLSRTGTTSLDAALWHLGIRSIHNPPAEALRAGDFRVFDEYQAGTDISVAAHFTELDAAFPGSTFILTVREASAWLASVTAHFARLPRETGSGAWGEVRERVYGAAWPTPEQFLAGYRAHLERVAAHFRNRPDDLLVLNIAAGDGWEKLCGFVGKETPATAFPNTNRSDGRQGVGHPHEASPKLSIAQMHSMFADIERASGGRITIKSTGASSPEA